MKIFIRLETVLSSWQAGSLGPVGAFRRDSGQLWWAGVCGLWHKRSTLKHHQRGDMSHISLSWAGVGWGVQEGEGERVVFKEEEEGLAGWRGRWKGTLRSVLDFKKRSVMRLCHAHGLREMYLSHLAAIFQNRGGGGGGEAPFIFFPRSFCYDAPLCLRIRMWNFKSFRKSHFYLVSFHLVTCDKMS